MGITDDIADKLALKAIEAEKVLNDDGFITQVSMIIGASSQTTQEAFLTAVRVRKSEARAHKFIEDRMAGQKGEGMPIGGDVI